MTRNQERTFSMYKNVKDCLTVNSSILSGLPQYNLYYNKFETSLNQIAIVQAKQLQSTTKVQTENKANLRTKCTNSAEKLLIAINAYTLISQNKAIVNQIPVFITKYKQAIDSEFAALCNNLYHASFIYAIDLENYGINADLFTDFRANIDSYTNIIATPRQTAIKNTATTTELANLFSQIKAEFADITILVTLKKFDEPVFYHSFVESSKIVNNGHTPYALRITLTATDNISLRNFIFNFTRQSDNKTLQYKTNENGRIVRLHLKAGVYTVTINKTGYTEKMTDITVESGITYKLNVLANTNDNTFDLQ